MNAVPNAYPYLATVLSIEHNHFLNFSELEGTRHHELFSFMDNTVGREHSGVYPPILFIHHG